MAWLWLPVAELLSKSREVSGFPCGKEGLKKKLHCILFSAFTHSFGFHRSPKVWPLHPNPHWLKQILFISVNIDLAKDFQSGCIVKVVLFTSFRRLTVVFAGVLVCWSVHSFILLRMTMTTRFEIGWSHLSLALLLLEPIEDQLFSGCFKFRFDIDVSSNVWNFHSNWATCKKKFTFIFGVEPTSRNQENLSLILKCWCYLTFERPLLNDSQHYLAQLDL